MAGRRKKRRLRQSGRFLIRISLFLLFSAFLHFFVMEILIVSDHSMFPALRTGDLCVFVKTEQYSNNDIALYEADGAYHIGRITAMSGTVDIKQGRLFLNGMQAGETTEYPSERGAWILPVHLQEDSWWILNDLRPDKEDSRTYGPVERKQIHGRLLYVVRTGNF